MANVDLAKIHAQQVAAFREDTAALGPLLERNGVREVLFSGTLTTQSGGAPVMFAPVRLAKRLNAKQIISGPVPYAVMGAGGDLDLVRKKGAMLPAGAYLLVFAENKAGWDTRIVDASGDTAATVATRQVAFQRGKKDDLIEKARELIRREGIDLRIVDIEIEFNGSTEVFVSFLFWRWSLFKDPPLPY